MEEQITPESVEVKTKELTISNQEKREISPEELIARAIDRNVPIETMERLLAMRTQLKEERAKEEFFKSLASFQEKCPIIPKTKEVGGSKFNYKYAPLDVIVEVVSPILKKCGFSYNIQACFKDNPPVQIVTCIVHHRAGHSESSEFRAPVDLNGYMNDIQKHASAMTYAKRYAFCNAFGILTGDEDNDAQGVTNRHEINNHEEDAENHQRPQNITPDVEIVSVKTQIKEELKSSVFDNDRARFEGIMEDIKTVPGLNGMLKRVQRECNDRMTAQSEK